MSVKEGIAFTAVVSALSLILANASLADAIQRPWVGVVYFYWYEWDYEHRLGNWLGGIHNTPLYGYYDSRTFADNYRSIWLAAEWGVTHFFLDYWGSPWKGEDGEPREATVLRAVEALRQKGYPIHIGYYQDGRNFEMREFSKNVTEKRDVYQWLRLYARSPAWSWLNGKPFQMVYARNGIPATTLDHEGFRKWLRERYGTIERLNRRWDARFASFDEIEMDFNAVGYQRAMSIKYQYELWRREWQRLEEAIQRELGLPGLAVSFDVHYRPFRGFGYADYVKTFGGPHSYGGIFGQPFDMDAERFLQSAVAKRYGTIFFDHLKNCYHDWNIRIPGKAYLADPFTYHRFWVGNLMRYSEGVLHMSWNEWWEGSNMEPTQEWGKRFCEENLFYSTLMHFCMDSIKHWNKDAQVALILNDWIFESGLGRAEDLYAVVQVLRRLNVGFDVIPEEFVTLNALRKFKAVIAPAGGAGFGENGDGERIMDVLMQWMNVRGGARLIMSMCDDVWERIGERWMRATPPPRAEPRPGGDLNLFVDVGVEGDDSIFVRGCSHREDWGKLPPGKFGADTRLTVRWTPATGNVTVLSLPASPYRKHILRIGATAIWSNEVSVRIGDRIVGGFKIEPGYQVYEIKISPDAIGSATAIEVQLVYKQAHVPGRIDPKRYGTESRVCNLAIDWIQFSTSNIPVGERRRMGIREANRVRLTDAIFTPYQGTVLNVPVSHRRAVAPQLAHGRIIAQYDDGIPRDIICEPDERLLVVNGLFCDSDAWWEAILRNWAGMNVPRYVRGEHIMSARLQAGDTQIILVENRDITEPAQITCHIPQRDTPLANITILSRDGAYIEPLNGYVDDGGNRAFRDKVMYYGVYELAFSPVRCEVPKMIIHPGETTLVQLRLQNLTDRQVRGEVAIESIVPSLRSQPVQVELKPHQALKAKVPLTARTDVDWGHKTVAIRLTFDDKTAYLFRRLTVETNARVTVRERAITSLEPYITVVNQPNRFIGAETAYDVRIHLQTGSRTRSSSARRNRIIKIGDIPSGQERRIKLPIGRMPVRQLQRTKLIKVKIAYRDSAGEHEVAVPLTVAFINRQATLSRANGAMAYIAITNGNDEPIDHAPIEVKLPLEVAGKITRTSKVVVYEPGGNPLPTQFDRTTRMLTFPALVPPHDTIVFTVRESNVASSHEIIATPLHTNARALGTGHGKVTIETNAFKVTLDESHGATVTQLISKVTGRDYGAGAFGVAYGTFSRYDPIKPAIDTTKFVVDDMVRQADGTGKLELVTIGPMRTVVRARYEDDAVRAIQTYTFYANSNAFRIDVHVEPKRLVGAQELVALDARFQPHLLYKSFPNFVGIRTDATDKVHYGWRMGAWVPPYFTLMNPPAFDESISLILRQASGVDAVRQGFWGEQRGKPGARKYAWIEIISTRKSTSKLTCWVLLHRGHQVIADKFSKSLERSPLVTVMPTAVRIAEGVQPRTLPRDWHLAYWHYRTYVKLSVPQPLRYSQPFALHIERIPSVAKFARAIDPNSFRVVRIRDGALIPCFYNADSKMLTWIINPNDGLHPEYFIYYDTKANVPKPKVTGGIEQLVVREKFDEPSVPPGWKFLHAELAKGEGVNGSNAVRLRIKGSDELALIHCYAIWVAPNARYSVRFKARVAYSADGKPFVRTNFFANRRYDFTQIQVDLKPDGKWHQYEVEVPTGAFPKDVRPFFRIWILSKPQEILIDDVEVRMLSAPNITITEIR